MSLKHRWQLANNYIEDISQGHQVKVSSGPKWDIQVDSICIHVVWVSYLHMYTCSMGKLFAKEKLRTRWTMTVGNTIWGLGRGPLPWHAVWWMNLEVGLKMAMSYITIWYWKQASTKAHIGQWGFLAKMAYILYHYRWWLHMWHIWTNQMAPFGTTHSA